MEDMPYPRYRWFILIVLCVVQAAVVMVLVGPVTIIGEIAKSLDIDMGMATQIMMVYVNVFIGISAFLGGGIVDRFGAYRTWIWCTIFFIISSLLVPLIGNSVSGILFIRLIHGIGAGPIMSTGTLVAAQWFPSKERGIIIGLQSAMVSAGAITTLNFVPFVFQKTGSWQAALSWLTVFFIITLILSIIVAIGPAPPLKNKKPIDAMPPTSRSDIKKVFRLPVTWAAISCSLWFSWVVRIINDLITGYLAIDPPSGVGMGPAGAGRVMSGANAFFTLAAISSGFILERIFNGRLRGLVLLGFILPAVLWSSIIFHAVYSNIFMLSAFIWTGAFGIALTSPLIMTFFAKSYPHGIMGKLGGILVTFNIAGTLVGTFTGSLTLSLTGRYDITIYLLGAGAFLGFLSSLLLKEPEVFSHKDEKIRSRGTG